MMMGENREFILAIALSILVLVAWEVFVGIPRMEQQRAQQQAEQRAQVNSQQQAAQPRAGSPIPAAPAPGTPASPAAPGVQPVLPGGVTDPAATPRVRIETRRVSGSINLTGARIDDLLLKDYRETVEKDSPPITLLSPSSSASPYYAEYGWSAAPATGIALPTSSTVWNATDGVMLTPTTPVTLTYDNGQGLVFRRTIRIDDNYLFSISQEVANNSGNPVTLHPYALISRHGRPDIQDFFVLHEGLIGVIGEEGLKEVDYGDLEDERLQSHHSTGGWIGITDKYWAAVLIPDQKQDLTARFSNNPAGGREIFQTDYLLGPQTVPSGGTATVSSQFFAGAKVVSIVDGYQESEKIDRLELLIDWGWFYFITKPMFWLLDFLFRLVGNFGIAILLATVLIKLVLFPLANKSYVSMSKMKLLQPEMLKLRERHADDRQKQQQAMMELYKKEQVNPMSGCLPILVQIPIFFALYKVLFGTIEMRHAPFYGWIQDLAAPDPTSIFNLFGLIPWEPPLFLMIGIWPIIMGVTMFLQMRLNPPPPDPIQAQIFNWMPLFFTFLLATFPAGLVIYWAWNNTLSILQQAVIMSRQGVKIELWDNLKSLVSSNKEQPRSEN